MKNSFCFFSVLLLTFFCSAVTLSQSDRSEFNNLNLQVPENIKQLLFQIKTAEDSEDWTSYYQLREQIVNEWQIVDPTVAALYSTTNSLEYDQQDPTAPQRNSVEFNNTETPLWGDDLKVYDGFVKDFSLAVGKGDTLYLGVLTGSNTNNATNIIIYRSANSGLNWTVIRSFSIPAGKKIELLDFFGSGGPSYLLLFSLYNDGRLWSTRISTEDLSFVNSLVVGGGCTDFAVDRSFPALNYRCFVAYDSSNILYTKRSDPSSYATIWQDRVSLFANTQPDIAYGLNGSLFFTFIGRNTGNLYVKENYSYGDPTSGFTQHTITTGSVDTTINPSIVSTRQDTLSQKVFSFFTKLSDGRKDLQLTSKTGTSAWINPINLAVNVNTDNINIVTYSRKSTGNEVIQLAFHRAALNNLPPRNIMHLKNSSAGWGQVVQVSDTNNATGFQKPSVVQLSNGLAAFAYAGLDNNGVYFDKEDWVSNINSEETIPSIFTLEQNYPNPFNPSTTISWQSPASGWQTLKVYDLLGNEVATLVDEYREAGKYNVAFDASSAAGGLSSGVYFYKIVSGGFMETKKMLLLK